MIIHNPILTGSFTVNGTDVSSITSSAASLTSLNSYTASQNNRNGTYATTGSNTFAGIQTVNSNLVVTGSITAQTLVVQTITSSVDFVTGSTRFGSVIGNTHVFTGSMSVSGSGTFAGIVGVGGATEAGWSLKSNGNLKVENSNGTTVLQVNDTSTGGKTWSLISAGAGNAHSIAAGSFYLRNSSDGSTAFIIASTGAATFSSSVNIGGDLALTPNDSAITFSSGAGRFFTGGSERMRITSTGNVLIGSNANSADTSLLTIKQASTAYNNGIYLERGGERNGYFMYIGGALDALTFRRNYFGTQSDVMSLTRDGNVGIGTSSPARKLDVYSDGIQLGDGGSFNFYMNSGPGAATGVTWTMNGTDRFRITAGGDINVLGGGSISTNGGAFRLRNSGQTASYGLFLTKAAWFGGGSTDYTPSIAAETGYGINTYTNGTTSPAGPYIAVGGTTWTAGSSDVRKKKNFETTQGLAEVLQVEPIKYHFNEDDDNSKKRLGFKAQNILSLIPEMVSETGELAEDGSPYLTVTPDYILPVLVKAIQELKAEIEILKNK